MSLLEKLCKFKIDQAYCISIVNNIEKQKRSLKECEKINQEVELKLVEKNKDGALGCLTSHLECIKKSKELGHKRILLMEDDIKFDLETINNLLNLNIDIPSSFDMLYLGYHINRGYKQSNNILKIVSSQVTHCYIMDSSIFDIVINNINNDWGSIPEYHDRNKLENMINWSVRAIDLFYSKWIHHRRNNSYGIYPIICLQYEGWSDIENKLMDYNKLMLGKSRYFYKMSNDSKCKTLVLNLLRREDRWKKFEENCELTNYTKFEAVDGKSFNFQEYMPMFNISDFSCCEVKNPYKNHGYQKGTLGCALSHYKIWSLIAQDETLLDNDFYLIVEDDITYVDNFKQKFEKTLSILRKDSNWDVTYIGFTDYLDTFNQDVYVHEGIIKLGGGKRLRGGGTFGYLIRKKGAIKLLNCVKHYQIKQAIDWFMIEQFDKAVFYKCEPELVFSEMANENVNVDSDIQDKDFTNLIPTEFTMNGKIYLKDQYNNYYFQSEHGEISYNGTFVLKDGKNHIIRRSLKKEMIVTHIGKINDKKIICFYCGKNSTIMTKKLAEILSDDYSVFIFNDSYDMLIKNVQYLYFEKFSKFSEKIRIDYLIITDITFFLHFPTIAKHVIIWNQNLLEKSEYNKTKLPNSGVSILHNVFELVQQIICPSDFSKILLCKKSHILKNNSQINIIPYYLNNSTTNISKIFDYKFICFDTNLVVIIKFFELIKKVFPSSTITLYSNDIESYSDTKICIKKRVIDIMHKDLETANVFITYENRCDTYYNILLAMNSGCITIFSNFFSSLKSKGISYEETILNNNFIETFSEIICNEKKRKLYQNIGIKFTQEMTNENILQEWKNILV